MVSPRRSSSGRCGRGASGTFARAGATSTRSTPAPGSPSTSTPAKVSRAPVQAATSTPASGPALKTSNRDTLVEPSSHSATGRCTFYRKTSTWSPTRHSATGATAQCLNGSVHLATVYDQRSCQLRDDFCWRLAAIGLAASSYFACIRLRAVEAADCQGDRHRHLSRVTRFRRRCELHPRRRPTGQRPN